MNKMQILANNAIWCLQGAVLCMHSRGVVHADIKSENILLTSPPGELFHKLCQFGFLATVLYIAWMHPLNVL